MGHAGEGVEIVYVCRGKLTDKRLQLGHAGEGVEIKGGQVRSDPHLWLQLGHAGEGVEIVKYGLPTINLTYRFNWATPVKAWR